MSRDAFSHDPGREQVPESRSSIAGRSARTEKESRATEEPAVARTISPGEQRLRTSQRKAEALDSPRAHSVGDRTYFVRESELQTLVEVGTFRAVAADDLARISYSGDTQRMNREIQRMTEQSLVTQKVVRVGRQKTVRLFALTRKGARLARSAGVIPEGQAIYHGFVKPREAKHDADLYRLFHAEAQRIEKAGGRLSRVVLDYELKRGVNRDLAALSSEENSEEARERIAERHGLAFVNGKIPVPDMRIEYDTADMEHRHLDLELATRNYRPRALAEKANAGFSLYALREDAARLRRVLDEREITAEILAL